MCASTMGLSAPPTGVTPASLSWGRVPFGFDTHVLPLLREMAEAPLADDYAFRERAIQLGLARDMDEADRLLELTAASGQLNFRGQQNGTGAWDSVFDVRITPKGLETVGFWPADDAGAAYLLERLGDAFAATADDLEADNADPETVGRLRSAARAIRTAGRELLVDVGARVIAHKLDG